MNRWKVNCKVNRKKEQMEWKNRRRKELPVQSERLRLTYFSCILVIYKGGFWRSQTEDNCVLTISFLILSTANCKAIRHKPQQWFKTKQNDCFMELACGQLCPTGSQSLFQICVWMCTICWFLFISWEICFAFDILFPLGRGELVTDLIKWERFKGNMWWMDWPHPPDIHNLFNVDLNLQMYGK